MALALVPAAGSIAASSDKDEMKARHKMEEVDLTAKTTLERLLKESETAKELFDKAYGYAVFDNLKLAFGISGGGGSGVAVEKATGKKTYMNMGTGGIGFGIGGQKYQVVFSVRGTKSRSRTSSKTDGRRTRPRTPRREAKESTCRRAS